MEIKKTKTKKQNKKQIASNDNNCERSELSGLFNAQIFYIYVYFRPYVVP